MRHLISLKEQSKKDLLTILDLAQKIKAKRNKGQLTNYLPNKTLIMLFQKTSTRTRLSFEVAMTELGGHAIFLDARTTQMQIGTDFIDEIKATMRYGHILMFRAIKASDVELAASLNQIPVIDACSEKYHPCQALGDMLTMIEHSKNKLNNVKKVTWLGMENNVMNSLMALCTKLGVKFLIAAPGIDEASVDKELSKQAEKTGLVHRTLDLKEAVNDTNYIHTDTWMNMEFFKDGKVLPKYENLYKQRMRTFTPYQLSAKIIDEYAPKAKIMHCMACHIGYEITRDAVDHKNSIIFDQAENRLHVQKAIIMWLLEKERLIV